MVPVLCTHGDGHIGGPGYPRRFRAAHSARAVVRQSLKLYTIVPTARPTDLRGLAQFLRNCQQRDHLYFDDNKMRANGRISHPTRDWPLVVSCDWRRRTNRGGTAIVEYEVRLVATSRWHGF